MPDSRPLPARSPIRRPPVWTAGWRAVRQSPLATRLAVLVAVAGVFAQHGASIRSMNQKGEGDQAELLILTHAAREDDLAATVTALRDLPTVAEVMGFMRVIGTEQ